MADVELLPLPEGYDKYDPPLLYEGQMFHEGQMRAYARANVARAVEPLQAEIDALRTRLEDTVRDSTNKIEALRAEVERLRADRDSWEQQASDRLADWHAEHLRAELLAEALETCLEMEERPKVIELARAALAAAQRPTEDGCHCATCTCNPNMTLAVRFDLSPAQMEGAIRDHLIRLGWTPPRARQPAALSGGINVAGMKALDDLLDHIYEYGTAAEGVLERATAFARDVLARYAPIVPEVGYAGVETDSLERRLDPDQAFCDMVQRALDSLGALWDAGTSATQPQGDKQ